MQTSIATVSLSGGLAEKLEAIAAAGFTGVEIFESDLLSFNGTPKDNQQALMPDRTMGAPATPGPKAVPRTVPDTPKAAEPSQASPSDTNAPIKQ